MPVDEESTGILAPEIPRRRTEKESAMSCIKTMIVATALTLMAVFAVSAQTYSLVKIKKSANVVEVRWPQVSVRETLEYLVDHYDADAPLPLDRTADDHDGFDREIHGRFPE